MVPSMSKPLGKEESNRRERHARQLNLIYRPAIPFVSKMKNLDSVKKLKDDNDGEGKEYFVALDLKLMPGDTSANSQTYKRAVHIFGEANTSSVAYCCYRSRMEQLFNTMGCKMLREKAKRTDEIVLMQHSLMKATLSGKAL